MKEEYCANLYYSWQESQNLRGDNSILFYHTISWMSLEYSVRTLLGTRSPLITSSVEVSCFTWNVVYVSFCYPLLSWATTLEIYNYATTFGSGWLCQLCVWGSTNNNWIRRGSKLWSAARYRCLLVSQQCCQVPLLACVTARSKAFQHDSSHWKHIWNNRNFNANMRSGSVSCLYPERRTQSQAFVQNSRGNNVILFYLQSVRDLLCQEALSWQSCANFALRGILMVQRQRDHSLR